MAVSAPGCGRWDRKSCRTERHHLVPPAAFVGERAAPRSCRCRGGPVPCHQSPHTPRGPQSCPAADTSALHSARPLGRRGGAAVHTPLLRAGARLVCEAKFRHLLFQDGFTCLIGWFGSWNGRLSFLFSFKIQLLMLIRWLEEPISPQLLDVRAAEPSRVRVSSGEGVCGHAGLSWTGRPRRGHVCGSVRIVRVRVA